MTKQDYVYVMRNLPSDIKQRLNEPEFLQALDELGEEFQLPIYGLITRMIVGEIALSELPLVLKKEYHCNQDVVEQCLGGLLMLGLEEILADFKRGVLELVSDSPVQIAAQTVLMATGGDVAQLVDLFWQGVDVGDSQRVLAVALVLKQSEALFSLFSSPRSLAIIGAELPDDPLEYVLSRVLVEQCHLSRQEAEKQILHLSGNRVSDG